MKLDIKGASNFVNRMFEACGKFQWAREFLMNAIEAKATRVEFGIEWQAVATQKIYRRTICDNGIGMGPQDLLSFFSTLGAGAKRIGGVHDNFGVGAKIASLPWNPNGMVVISYNSGTAAMIWIYLDEDSEDYQLREFKCPDGTRACVIDPKEVMDSINWSSVAPDWVRKHGTVVVLLGSKSAPDTVLGNPDAGEDDLKGLTVYLNSRFWDLDNLDTTVVELRNQKKNLWPRSPLERDDARRTNNRKIKGARHYLAVQNSKLGKLAHTGVCHVANDRVAVEWYLWEGKRPEVHTYAKENGYIAIQYGDELFQHTSGKVEFRNFGIIESSVQTNLALILKPQRFKDGGKLWGIHPDQSRNRIIFTGDGDKGGQIPLNEWGAEFASKMPKQIFEAIRKARSGLAGSIDDENYRKRLQNKFGKRWTMKLAVSTLYAGVSPAVASSGDVLAATRIGGNGVRVGSFLNSILRRQKKVIPASDGAGGSIMREVPVDVPRYEFTTKENFDRPWHLAQWTPLHPDGPTVLINQDSPILQESVEHHLKQYPDVFAEEVANTVRGVFGELAACKIAHSQMLSRHIPEKDIDNDYRSEKSLTISLMGLLAEESVIAHRLKKLGQRVKPQA